MNGIVCEGADARVHTVSRELDRWQWSALSCCTWGKMGSQISRGEKKPIRHPGQRSPATSLRTSHSVCQPACLSESEPSLATEGDEQAKCGEMRARGPEVNQITKGKVEENYRTRARSSLTTCGLPIRPALRKTNGPQAGRDDRSCSSLLTSRAP